MSGRRANIPTNNEGDGMRKIALGLLAMIMVGLAVLSGNTASAEASTKISKRAEYITYVRELAPEAAPRFSDTVLWAMGQRVCKDYRRGLPEDSIAETIERMYLNHKVHFNFTARILQASQLYRCPKFL